MALDESDRKEIGDIVSKALSGDEFTASLGKAVRPIVVGVVKSESKSLTESLGDVTKLVANLGEKESARAKKEEGDGAGEGGGGDNKPAKPDAETARLQAQVRDLEKRDSEREAERKATVEKADRANKRAGFDRAANNLKMRAAEVAFSHLQERIKVDDDDDSKVFVVAQRDGYTEDVPLETWLQKEWLPTDTGKTFAPAGETGGSGGRAGEGGGTGTGSKGKDAIDSALASAGWGP